MRNFEPTFKEYIIAVLFRWRFILVLSLITAFTMSTVGYLSQNELTVKSALNTQQQREENQKAIQEKEEQLAVLREKSESLDHYIDESILMQADSNRIKVASVILSIDVPESVYRTNTVENVESLVKAKLTRITNHYTVLLNSTSLMEILKPILSGEQKEEFLREALSIESPSEGIIYISFAGSKEVDAEEAAIAIANYAVSKRNLVSRFTGDHGIAVFNQSNVYFKDDDIDALRVSILGDKKEVDQQIESIQLEVEKLRATVPIAPIDVIYIIRQFFTGLLAGGLLGIVLAGIRFLSTVPVQLPEQIQKVLHIRLLGVIGLRYQGILGKVYECLLGVSQPKDEDEALKLTSANLAEAMKDYHRVLFTGSLSKEVVDKITQRIQPNLDSVEMLLADSVTQSADAVAKLHAADAVVLVERLQLSRMENVVREIERIEVSGKKILGYILC